jgi:molecular chaperone HscB
MPSTRTYTTQQSRIQPPSYASPLAARRLYSSTSSTSEPSSSSTPQPEHVGAHKPATFYEFFPSTLPLGPPPAGTFSIELPKLRREFLQLQARAHPDRHHGAAKARAEAASAAINEAYRTLEDPLRRAVYVLGLRGVDVDDESSKLGGAPGASGDEAGFGGAGGDMELLMEVMDAREAVEEAQSEEEIAALGEENEERIAGSIRVLEEAFAASDWARARRETVRLRYWRNIGESLREWNGPGSVHVLEH